MLTFLSDFLYELPKTTGIIVLKKLEYQMQLINGTLEYISTSSYLVISESNWILDRGVDFCFLLMPGCPV